MTAQASAAPKDPVASALDHVRSRSQGTPVDPGHRITLNFHPDTETSGIATIASMARDGVYRSQFETGVSNGGSSAHPGGERWLWESRMFGGAYDACAGDALALRPKYGVLNFRADPVGGSRRFGSCHLRLRPGVLGRTTFCYPDSHLHPEHFGVGDRVTLVDMARENRRGLEPLDDYVEAHVHGVLRIADDVEAVMLDPCYRGTPVEAAARRMPCGVGWHDGFRLPPGRLEDCARYRGREAADAVARVGQGGIVTPSEIGAARRGGMDRRLTKWAWHCVARFGHRFPEPPTALRADAAAPHAPASRIDT